MRDGTLRGEMKRYVKDIIMSGHNFAERLVKNRVKKT
jgi:hypothetical protein